MQRLAYKAKSPSSLLFSWQSWARLLPCACLTPANANAARPSAAVPRRRHTRLAAVIQPRAQPHLFDLSRGGLGPDPREVGSSRSPKMENKERWEGISNKGLI